MRPAPPPGVVLAASRRSRILVTGANGGVGSIAVAILANLGHHVIDAAGARNTPTACATWAPRRSSTAPN